MDNRLLLIALFLGFSLFLAGCPLLPAAPKPAPAPAAAVPSGGEPEPGLAPEPAALPSAANLAQPFLILSCAPASPPADAPAGASAAPDASAPPSDSAGTGLGAVSPTSSTPLFASEGALDLAAIPPCEDATNASAPCFVPLNASNLSFDPGFMCGHVSLDSPTSSTGENSTAPCVRMPLEAVRMAPGSGLCAPSSAPPASSDLIYCPHSANLSALDLATVPLCARPAPSPQPPALIWPHDGQPMLEVMFFDVGLGDATLVRTRRATVLIDTGPSESADALVKWLERLRVEHIDLVILDSWKAESSGGLGAVARRFPITALWHNGDLPTSRPYRELASLLEGQKIALSTPVSGHRSALGDLSLDVFNPTTPRYNNPALDSLVVRVNHSLGCFLFTGDIDQDIEPHILDAYDGQPCAYYKLPGNGKGRPTPSLLLDRVRPSAVFLSVGPNDHDLPSPTTLDRISISKLPLYRTDAEGDGVYFNATVSLYENEARFVNISALNVGQTADWYAATGMWAD